MLRGVVYFQLENWASALGPKLRSVGQNLFRSGVAMQGAMGHEDYRVPSMRCIPISDSKFPRLLASDWVAPNATVIGDVNLGEGASLWHGAVVRGDQAIIAIGKNSIIQDNVHIGSTAAQAKDYVSIGDNVQVGPNAHLDACTLENFYFVGMGATVNRGSTIESFGVVSAGAVVGA
jgi:gamma-carbonic anhydrase